MPCCRPSRESEADAAARALGVDATNEAGPLAGAGGRCTDALCLLCIIACWLGLTILGLVVTGVPGFAVDTLPAGDPRRLLFGVDYLGDVCSVEEHTTYHADGSYKTYDVSALRKSYYLPSGAVVCVRACPSEDDARRFVCDYDAAAAPDIGGALAASEPMDAPTPRPTLQRGPSTSQPSPRPTPAPTTPKPTAVYTPAPTFNASLPCTQALDRAYCDSLVGKNGSRAYCYDWFCPTCALPGACDFACGFCESRAPTPLPQVPQRDGASAAVYEEIAADVFATRDWILLFGFLVAAAFGFAYLVVLQIPFLLFAMVWVLLASVLIILVAAAALAAATARDWAAEDPPAHSERELQVMRALAAVLVVASVLYACLLVALRKRITLAIGILKEAARALTTMPALALLPVVQCAGLARPGAEVSARRVIGRRPRRSSSSRSGSSTPPTWPPRASSRRATSNITARRSPTRNSNTRGTSGGPPSTSCSAGSGRASSSSRWGSSSWRARSSSGISRETRQRRRS